MSGASTANLAWTWNPGTAAATIKVAELDAPRVALDRWAVSIDVRAVSRGSRTLFDLTAMGRSPVKAAGAPDRTVTDFNHAGESRELPRAGRPTLPLTSRTATRYGNCGPGLR